MSLRLITDTHPDTDEVLTLVTFAVAVVAAARSTWSPCGWSMLSTITPLAERRRGHRFLVTAGWYVLGAVLGGLGLGLVGALLAAVVPSVPVAIPVAACLVVAISDAPWGPTLPIHRRQVNEDWLEAYRPMVYGLGFGAQIGSGLATFITTSTVYLVVVLSAFGSVPAALVAGVSFGLVRGLAVLLSLGSTSPERLQLFHRRFAAAGPWSQEAVVLVVSVGAMALSGRPELALVPGVLLLVPQTSWRRIRLRSANQPGTAGT